MGSRLLLVDDSEAVRQGLRSVLQAIPECDVCGEASDGLTAVEMFREMHPSMVILDFQLPGIDGLEVARRMAQISASVPILMFTQHANPALDKLARGIGIRSVVSKAKANVLLGVIQSLLGSSDPKVSASPASKSEQSQLEES
jgi:DNA-binding NarL/FixJ family response regulator